MNLNICVKVKEEIENLITSSIIEAMEESEWVSPMVINIKKDGRIRIFFYFKDLYAVCVIDLFLTPFIEEILEGVVGHVIYAFTDGFSGYHQVRIAK